MSPVWTLSRAAAGRRRAQTVIIGIVAFVSAVMLVLALGLLSASSSPFADAFDQQHGAQLNVIFNEAKVSGAQLAATSRAPGVTASAGPFPEVAVNVEQPANSAALPPAPPGPLTIVGRSNPGGAVDDVDLWFGHWPTGPGQVVVNRGEGGQLGPGFVGSTMQLAGGQSLTVVGAAYSVSQSAGAWVTPSGAVALGADQSQMLYRFSSAATSAQVRSDLASVTRELAPGAVTGSQSYLSVEEQYATTGGGPYVPFLLAFGVLALVVAVVIVANVVSGAVVAGLRHIGVMKSLGYTPNQVLSVYLLMVSFPAALGTVAGTAAGALVSKPLLRSADQGLGLPATSVSLWVEVAVLVGVPAVVLLAAYLSALRAKWLPAARAITAGAAPAAGRGLRAQRALAGTPLPRPVSLGLGLPFARPGRTLLTLLTLALGVTSVTLAAGMTSTAIKYGHLIEHSGAVQVDATVNGGKGPGRVVGGGLTVASAESDLRTEQLLRSLPGARTVTATLPGVAELVGTDLRVDVDFLRGDTASLGYPIVKGHWIDGPYQAVVGPGFLKGRNLAVGDHVSLTMGGASATVTIVGETWSYDPHGLMVDWHTATILLPGRGAINYDIGLRPGTNVNQYVVAVRQADPSLLVQPNASLNSAAQLISNFSTLFTVMLAIVAALGVLNTILLTTRERRRDLGMLKSIGMTPRQVAVMMVTSAAVLGVAGSIVGVPLGMLVHQVVVPAMVRAANIILPSYMLNVWDLGLVGALAFSGILIAALGAFAPARNAGRLTIATVLHNE